MEPRDQAQALPVQRQRFRLRLRLSAITLSARLMLSAIRSTVPYSPPILSDQQLPEGTQLARPS